MTNERVIELMKCERECVKRQFGPLCKRTIIPMEGCFGCDLVQNDKDVLEAYDAVIKALESGCDSCIRNAEGEPCDSVVCDYEKRPTEDDSAAKKLEQEAYEEARREAMRLDDNEDTYKFRGYC